MLPLWWVTTSTATPVASDRHKHLYVSLGALVFGAAMGLFIGLSTGSGYYGFHGGFFSGAAFGWMLKRFMKLSPLSLTVDARNEGFDEDETIVLHNGANHFKGIEAVGGKLFLTNKRLRFRSHRFNVQAHDESYPLDAIHAVEAVRTLGIIPNGLVVQLKDGRRQRFVVMNRSAWLAQLARRP